MTDTTISRRAMIGGLAAATAMPASAGAALVDPAKRYRIDELACELADALNDHDGGAWYALVYPSAGRAYPVALVSQEAAAFDRAGVSVQMNKAVAMHRTASRTLAKTGAVVDRSIEGGPLSRAEAKVYRAAVTAESRARAALCAIVPRNRPEREMKVRALLAAHRSRPLSDGQLAALLLSIAGA